MKMEKQTGYERNRLNESRMDPDSWSWSTLDEPNNQLPTGTHDLSEHQPTTYYKVALENRRQWSSTYCYGRGKKLSDVVVPRLPKVFQNDFPSADYGLRDINWQNKGGRRYGLQRPHAVGRGVTFQDVPVRQMVDSPVADVEYVLGAAEPAPPIATTASTISDDPRTHPLLIDINSDLDAFHVPEREKKSSWCIESETDFPAFSAGISTSSGPLHSRRVGVGGQLTSSDIFEDAEEPVPGPSGDFTRVSQSIKSEIQNETDSFADLCITSASVEKETDANVECSGDFMEPSADLSRDGGPKYGLTSRLNDSISPLWKGGFGGTSNSSADMFLRASLLKYLHRPESGVTVGNAFPNNLSQEDNDGIPAEDEASAPKAQPPVSRKKKLVSGWKLGGACVVEIANTPKGCAEKLREMVNVIAKVEDFENKSKKRNLICRFRLQSKEECREVIKYIDGDKPFDGQTKALECRLLGGGETLETDE